MFLSFLKKQWILIKKENEWANCTTPTLSNYMVERLCLKCPSKGHHLVMKVIANWFFFFQINFFPYHPGNHQPSHYGPSSVSCCNLCFFLPSSIAWQWLYGRSSDLFMSVISNVGYIEEDGPDIGTPLKTTCHSHPFPSSFSHLPKSKTAEPAKKKTVSTVLSHLPLAHLSLLQVTRTGPF